MAAWSLNTVAALLLGFQMALTAKDPATLLAIAFCHVVALGLAYASVRIRFNVMGLLLFFLSGVLYFAFLVQLFLTRFPFKPF